MTDSPARRADSVDMSNDRATVRQIDLAGLVNFRDMGGYRSADGRSVKWRRLYRAGELVTLTDDDLETLAALGIRTVVDLRSEDEVSTQGRDRLPAGASLMSIAIEPEDLIPVLGPAFAAGDFSLVPTDLLHEINRAYVSEWGSALGAFLRVVADAANCPLVFHCTHGKDRTGITAAMLLSALGVPWDVVMEDYLLSNLLRREQAEAGLNGLRDAAARQRGVPSDVVDTTNIRGLFYVDASYLEAAHDEIITGHGSVEVFIRDGMGLTDSVIGRLRAELLE